MNPRNSGHIIWLFVCANWMDPPVKISCKQSMWTRPIDSSIGLWNSVYLIKCLQANARKLSINTWIKDEICPYKKGISMSIFFILWRHIPLSSKPNACLHHRLFFCSFDSQEWQAIYILSVICNLAFVWGQAYAFAN